MADQPATVLVIDDDRSLLLGVQLVLQKAGYGVLTSEDGENGLQLAVERHPDLILCDIMMPGLNGLELRRRMAGYPDLAATPFIFLTARVSRADKLHGIDSGADDYITKPFDREELLARIRAILRRDGMSRQQGQTAGELQFQELQRVVSKIIGEELRMPVARLSVVIEAMLSDKFAGDRDKQRAFIQLALNNVQQLQDMIEDLTTLSEMDQGRMGVVRQVIDMQTDFYEPVERRLQRWEARHLDVCVEVEPEVVAYAPNADFRQAAAHLVDNACKFSPRGGRVEVKLAVYGQGGCILTVSDQGPGIPVELREKVFERYFQGNEGNPDSTEGLGVGLTIARSFARRLGGDVIFLDSPAGCRVLMTIPPTSPDREIT